MRVQIFLSLKLRRVEWRENEKNLKTSLDMYVFTSFIYFFLKYKKRRDC